MERVGRAVGVALRPNSSLAGVWGSSGLASGGSGWGLCGSPATYDLDATDATENDDADA
jgi:hypothetical protein